MEAIISTYKKRDRPGLLGKAGLSKEQSVAERVDEIVWMKIFEVMSSFMDCSKFLPLPLKPITLINRKP